AGARGGPHDRRPGRGRGLRGRDAPDHPGLRGGRPQRHLQRRFDPLDRRPGRRPRLRAGPGPRVTAPVPSMGPDGWPPETDVIFVRHGNVHNPRNLIYGRLPRMRLSQKGIEDVERTAHYLADLPIAAIYTSPLLRARQTAAIIARHCGAPVHRNASLAEVHTSWQGESNAAVREIKGFSYYDPLKAEGDETILDVFTRMDRALRV